MSAKLTLVKRIVDRNEEVVNSYNLILSALFGNKLPELYDPNKTYVKGDSKEDGLTGPFNDEMWTKIAFTELFKEGSALSIDFTKAIQVSEIQPEDKDNVIWLQSFNKRTVGNINIR